MYFINFMVLYRLTAAPIVGIYVYLSRYFILWRLIYGNAWPKIKNH